MYSNFAINILLGFMQNVLQAELLLFRHTFKYAWVKVFIIEAMMNATAFVIFVKKIEIKRKNDSEACLYAKLPRHFFLYF